MLSIGIETFLTVVGEKNITSAATKMHVAQSTISQRLTDLEQEVGMRLIDRGKGMKHLQLTPLGNEFFKLAQEWEKIWRQALVLKEEGPKLFLSVGATDSINNYLLPPVFEALNTHNPVVGLSLNSIHSWGLYSELENGNIDIGLGLHEVLSSNVTCTKFFSTKMVIIRPKGSVEQTVNTLMPEELDSNQEIQIHWGNEFQVWHDKWWNPLAHSRIKVDYFHLALTLLKDPKQWLIIPQHIAIALLKANKNYCIYDIGNSPPPYCCYKLTRKYKTQLTEQALSIFDKYLMEYVVNNNFNDLIPSVFRVKASYY